MSRERTSNTILDLHPTAYYYWAGRNNEKPIKKLDETLFGGRIRTEDSRQKTAGEGVEVVGSGTGLGSGRIPTSNDMTREPHMSSALCHAVVLAGPWRCLSRGSCAQVPQVCSELIRYHTSSSIPFFISARCSKHERTNQDRQKLRASVFTVSYSKLRKPFK